MGSEDPNFGLFGGRFHAPGAWKAFEPPVDRPGRPRALGMDVLDS